MKNLAVLLLSLSLVLSCVVAAQADEATPIVIPMGEPAYPDEFLLPSPSPAAQYVCSMPQETIRQRVLLALSFSKQGSHAKAQHVLQILLNEL